MVHMLLVTSILIFFNWTYLKQTLLLFELVKTNKISHGSQITQALQLF
jgi:hypothetical protein